MKALQRLVLSVAGPLAISLFVGPVRAQPQPASLTDIGVREHLGAQVPLERAFTTSQGARIRLGQVLGNGKPTLLVLAYSHCTMLCNLVLRGAGSLVHDMTLRPGRDYNAVTIGIDPHELPGEASRTQQMLLVKAGYAGEPSRWPFLVGTKDDIDAVASALGFRYRWDPRTEQYAHPAVLFLLSPEGRVTHYFYGLRNDADTVEQALRGSAPPAGVRAAAASVLSCFRFDTLSQKYGGRIRLAFQLGAAAVLAALILAITRLWRRPGVEP